MIVKMLNALLKGKVRKITLKMINASFPGRLKWLTGYVAIIVGAGLTFLVQSSSVFTSALTPLVGSGVITIYRMFPLTLGSNIGTTTTGILAAFAQDGSLLADALHIAFCHLFFNIFGILIWYPIPKVRSIPIKMAKALGNKTAKHRWFSVLYLALAFFILPGAIFGLSLLGWLAIAIVGGAILLLVVIVTIVNVLQRTRCGRHCMPECMHTWDFLPLFCHSLKPYDKCFACGCCRSKEDRDVVHVQMDNAKGADNLAYKF
jgi:sodium-dependent phosphate cotransporter